MVLFLKHSEEILTHKPAHFYYLLTNSHTESKVHEPAVIYNWLRHGDTVTTVIDPVWLGVLEWYSSIYNMFLDSWQTAPGLFLSPTRVPWSCSPDWDQLSAQPIRQRTFGQAIRCLLWLQFWISQAAHGSSFSQPKLLSLEQAFQQVGNMPHMSFCLSQCVLFLHLVAFYA